MDKARKAMKDYQGILLVGPTGSGKTPLGERIEAKGLAGRQYRHFDFGANLRQVVAAADATFTSEEHEFLHSVLQSGALLEDDRFPIAERILKRFLEARCADGETQIVLNGLPRHAGQAEAVGRIVRIHSVVALECSEEIVLMRIGTNIGGDRSLRTDDTEADVRRKLAIYSRRTDPLVDYYRRAGCTVISLPITTEMAPDDAWEALQSKLVEHPR